MKELAQTEPRAASKYKIPSSYVTGIREQQLTGLLLAWAEKEAASLWGSHTLFGGLGIIGDGTIHRIVALASEGVLSDVAALKREVVWYYMLAYGPKVLELVKQTHPIQTNGAPVISDANAAPLSRSPGADDSANASPQPSPPLSPRLPQGSKSARLKISPGRSRGPYHCRSCGNTGHNGKRTRSFYIGRQLK